MASLLRLWDLRRPGEAPLTLLSGDASATTFLLSPSGDRLLANVSEFDPSQRKPGRFTIHSWDLKEPRRPPIVFERDAGPIFRGGLSADGRWLVGIVIDSGRNIVQLHDLDRPEAPPVILFEDGYHSFAFHPDGRRVLFAGDNGEISHITLSDPKTQPLRLLRMPEGARLSLQIHPDGHRIAAAGPDGTIYLGDLEHPNDQPVALRGHVGAVREMAFLPDRKRLLSISEDGTLRVWSLDLGDLLEVAEQRAGRNLRKAEWEGQFLGRDYRKTFDRLPNPWK